MRLVRLALVHLNTTVGATKSNVDRAVGLVKKAAAGNATLIVLPEQTVGGYMQEDLVQWPSFVHAQWNELERFADETASIDAAIALGCVVGHGNHVYSTAVLVHRGRILGVVPKEKLPTYNVFYEGRTLSRGFAGMNERLESRAAAERGGVPFGDLVFDFDFGSVALEVCEDAWSPEGPMRRRCFAGAEIVLNLSASPFRVGVTETRREMIATRSADNECTVAYANLVGGNDGLVFDGGGFVTQNGRVVLEATRYEEGVSFATIDLNRTRRLRLENTTWRTDSQNAPTSHVVHVDAADSPKRDALSYPSPAGASFFLPQSIVPRSARVAFCEDLLDSLALGLGDYFEKTGAFKHIGVALSGGRDSLLSLIIATRYVRRRFRGAPEPEVAAKVKDMLRAFYMPSRFSSKETENAAVVAANELGVPITISPIDDAFTREITANQAMLQPGEELTALAKQNIQARIRAERMWTWANSTGGLFVQTSNMSEKSVGYTTIGGDMEGALSVIANVPKTVVNFVLDYLLETSPSEGIRLLQ